MYQMGGSACACVWSTGEPSLNFEFCNKYHVARVIPMGISVWPRGVQYGAYRYSGTYSAEPPTPVFCRRRAGISGIAHPWCGQDCAATREMWCIVFEQHYDNVA